MSTAPDGASLTSSKDLIGVSRIAVTVPTKSLETKQIVAMIKAAKTTNPLRQCRSRLSAEQAAGALKPGGSVQVLQHRNFLGVLPAVDKRLYRMARGVMPAISKTEQIALGCGTIGKPDINVCVGVESRISC